MISIERVSLVESVIHTLMTAAIYHLGRVSMMKT
jgi:hypothetical protein